jgi:hypothetical protein
MLMLRNPDSALERVYCPSGHTTTSPVLRLAKTPVIQRSLELDEVNG